MLGTNMGAPQAVNMGGVTTGEYLMLRTDQPILVAVDSVTSLWTVSKALLVVGEFSAVYLQNQSLTNLATVEIVITD